MIDNYEEKVYAGILGILLAWFMEKAGHFYGALLAHIGANLISVLRVETKLFSWMHQNQTIFIITTIGMLLVSIVLITIVWLQNNKNVK